MTPRVTFVRTDDPSWKRTTNCDIPVAGDIITMIDNEDETVRAAYKVIAVNRLFIDVGYHDFEGNLLQQEIRVAIEPFTNGA